MADHPASVQHAVERALAGALGTIERQLDELQNSFQEVRRLLDEGTRHHSPDRFVGLLPSLMHMQAAGAALAAGIETVLRFVGVSSQWSGVSVGRGAQAAGAVIEEELAAYQETSSALAGHAPSLVTVPTVDVDSLPEELRALHLKAKRFAKVTVQELAMYKKEEVVKGRENKDLYQRFKEEIDKSKQLYDKRFERIAGHNIDYLYDELVRVLAENEPSALGDYPYPTPASPS